MNGYAVLIPQVLLLTSIKLYIYIIYFHTYITIFVNNCLHKFNYVDMKKLLLFLSLILSSCIFISCDSDDEIMQEEEEELGMLISSSKNIIPIEQIKVCLSEKDSMIYTLPSKYLTEKSKKMKGIAYRAIDKNDEVFDGYGFGWNIGEEESIRKVHFRGLTFEHINDTTIKCTVDKVDEEAEMIKIYIDINDSFHHGTSCITFNR